MSESNTRAEDRLAIDVHVAICLELARAGIPSDLVELLVQGDPMRGIAPLALDRAISTALEASGRAVVDVALIGEARGLLRAHAEAIGMTPSVRKFLDETAALPPSKE